MSCFHLILTKSTVGLEKITELTYENLTTLVSVKGISLGKAPSRTADVIAPTEV